MIDPRTLKSIDQRLLDELLTDDNKFAEAVAAGVGYYIDGQIAWGAELLAVMVIKDTTLTLVVTTGIRREEQ